MDTDVSSSNNKATQRERLKAYKPSILPETLASYREQYDSMRDLQHISFTEFVTYRDENRMHIFNEEFEKIRTKDFCYNTIRHSDHLVAFYTGIPNANMFFYICSRLPKIEWEDDGKHELQDYTMITLMKLRLNMSDEELADRFGIESYVVNMTLRSWLPTMYNRIYKKCERVRWNNDAMYSRVLDIVEVCFETPEYIRHHRGNKHEARKAVMSVRYDGFINYASSIVSVNRPDTETIKRSRISDICSNMDIIALNPEHLPTVSAMGIACQAMSSQSEVNMEATMSRLSEFRILMAIPEEYKTCEYIFPVCAALSNFALAEDA